MDRHSVWQQQVQADCNQKEVYLEVWEFGHLEQALRSMHAAFCRCTSKHSYQSRDSSPSADGLFPVPMHSASHASFGTRVTAAIVCVYIHLVHTSGTCSVLSCQHNAVSQNTHRLACAVLKCRFYVQEWYGLRLYQYAYLLQSACFCIADFGQHAMLTC